MMLNRFVNNKSRFVNLVNGSSKSLFLSLTATTTTGAADRNTLQRLNYNNGYNNRFYSSSSSDRDRKKESKELEDFVKQQTNDAYGKPPATQSKPMNRKERRTMEHQLSRNSQHLVVAGVVSPKLDVPTTIPYPPYANGEPLREYDLEDDITVASAEDIKGMRASCKLAKEILEFAGKMVRAGITTDEIDRAVHAEIVRRDAYPSTLGYKGYPKSICTSINEIICHGIPDSRPLQDGDIINIDITVYYKGYHGDTSATFTVGQIDSAAAKLIEVTKMALDAGIKAVKPDRPFSDIGKAIQAVAHKHSFSIPIEFTAHGIGKEFHTPPFIFQVANDLDYIIKKDMIFTIEPILVESTKPFTDWKMWDDNWTISSTEGGWAAQFEHTILVTDNGAEILTQ
ncbi:methionine aminopeptidase [Heterostelium album PN500]|uniref:Methionine aminopeptidase n=1 Tax=Heterostelium pallidum (strain ATCC 26659 / Pp 5 / PN500) TaxID=670386 RepID=D3BGF6_HETP5|nr:methionine aminopeptidase [Heterostelium album PN500]EFA79556.1 methionine aminopeptidase [Heterostelium album PN500]|eukprot:XP_020431677.1 methionine aminopeptidase [Heterostelium album PN500]